MEEVSPITEGRDYTNIVQKNGGGLSVCHKQDLSGGCRFRQTCLNGQSCVVFWLMHASLFGSSNKFSPCLASGFVKTRKPT